MSSLYLATDPRTLAVRLADLLDRAVRAGDPFQPATIVIPNRYLRNWLRLFLARNQGIAVNLRFTYLEQAIWDMLRQVDPRDHAAEPEMLDGEHYRLLVLSALLESDDPDLAPFRRYLGEQPWTRRSWRRAWQLANRLSGLIRDYEYHRQDALIQPWIMGKL